jgi:polyisoprenoid-binding protein YceI
MALVNTALAEFTIDAHASLFTVQAFASGIVAVVAHSPKFAVRSLTGTVAFAPDNLEDAILDLSIKVSSLDLMDEVRTNERREIERVMFDEVLESAKHPTVTYKTSRVTAVKMAPNSYRLTLFGDLTLHGVTRGQKIESQVMIGEDTLKAQGSFSLMQSDFALKIASVAGGSLKLKDEIKCGYFMIARRSPK